MKDAETASRTTVELASVLLRKTTDYGEEYWTDRGYEAEDLEGHHWWFVQRLRTPGKDAE
jgi:uncharacterized glyoxalase superfamily protein PhnB